MEGVHCTCILAVIRDELSTLCCDISHCSCSPQNFTLKDALLFEEYLFVKLMEVFDWAECELPPSGGL